MADTNINIHDLGSNAKALIEHGCQEELLTGLVALGAYHRARELVAPTSAALQEAIGRRDRAAADLEAWERGKAALEQHARELQARVILETDKAKRALLQEGALEAQHAVTDYCGGDAVLRSRLNDAKRDAARLSGALEVLRDLAARRPECGLLDTILKGK
jgi:hypothetical protein